MRPSEGRKEGRVTTSTKKQEASPTASRFLESDLARHDDGDPVQHLSLKRESEVPLRENGKIPCWGVHPARRNRIICSESPWILRRQGSDVSQRTSRAGDLVVRLRLGTVGPPMRPSDVPSYSERWQVSGHPLPLHFIARSRHMNRMPRFAWEFADTLSTKK